MVGFAEAPPGSEAPGVIIGYYRSHYICHCVSWRPPARETMEEYIAEIRQKTFTATSIDKKAASSKTKVTEAGLQRKGPSTHLARKPRARDRPGSWKL